MTEVQRFVIEDDGKIVEIYVETPEILNVPVHNSLGKRPGEKGSTDDIIIKMQEAQEKIKTYTKFVIDAFNQVAEVEEVTLKFGMKLNGKASIIFTEASAEGSLEVQIKCKFTDALEKSSSTRISL